MSDADPPTGRGAGPEVGPEPQPAGRGRRALLIAIVVAALALFVFLRRSDRRPPSLPGDLVHSAASAGRLPESCLTCHARSGPAPQPPSHTGRQDCANCHLPAERR